MKKQNVFYCPKTESNEQGSALVISMLVIALVAVISMVYMQQTQNDMKMSIHKKYAGERRHLAQVLRDKVYCIGSLGYSGTPKVCDSSIPYYTLRDDQGNVLVEGNPSQPITKYGRWGVRALCNAALGEIQIKVAIPNAGALAGSVTAADFAIDADPMSNGTRFDWNHPRSLIIPGTNPTDNYGLCREIFRTNFASLCPVGSVGISASGMCNSSERIVKMDGDSSAICCLQDVLIDPVPFANLQITDPTCTSGTYNSSGGFSRACQNAALNYCKGMNYTTGFIVGTVAAGLNISCSGAMFPIP